MYHVDRGYEDFEAKLDGARRRGPARARARHAPVRRTGSAHPLFARWCSSSRSALCRSRMRRRDGRSVRSRGRARRVDDASARGPARHPGFLALAHAGGAALLVMTDAGATLQDFGGAVDPSPSGASPTGWPVDLGSMAGETGSTSPEKLAAAAEQLAVRPGRVHGRERCSSSSPRRRPTAPRRPRRIDLGALVMATGTAAATWRRRSERGGTDGPLRTSTSDSTRRDGVVAAADVASDRRLDFVGDRRTRRSRRRGRSAWSTPRPRSACTTGTSSRSG